HSCPIMNKIHPTFQCYPAFPSQYLHRISKCLCCSLVISCSEFSRAVLENRAVKVTGQVSPIRIRHCPHRTHDTSKSAELNSCCKMQHFVRDTLVSQLRGVASGKEGKL